LKFTLPTEREWEYACRAGSDTPLHYGQIDADFSAWANVGDKLFKMAISKDGKQITGGLEHMLLEGATLADGRFSDGAVVTTAVGSYKPNAWGLHDMHGNAAEWTISSDPESKHTQPRGVVCGGSFFDRPERCSSAARADYPAWLPVFNVGFRVVAHDDLDAMSPFAPRK
jgi:formylglycine-generating enzyme required for sulfatase activity